MDQPEWSALGQMLSTQPSVGQQQYVQSGPASSIGRAPRGGGRLTNGTSRSHASHDSEAGKYGQSILRPELIKGTQQAAKSKPQSLLQPQLLQQQAVELEPQQADEGQLQLAYSDIAEQMGSGQTFLAVVNGVTYQIIDDSKHGLIAQPTGDADGSSVLPFGSGISLEDLANISAQQETLQLNYGTADTAVEGAALAQDGTTPVMMTAEEQEYLQQTHGGTIVTTEDGMQVLVLPEGYDTSSFQQEGTAVASDGAQMGEMTSTAGGMISVDGQEFVLQPGQELPPELQEMVVRGLPIDFSNYELVIQESDEGADGASGGVGYVVEGQHPQVRTAQQPAATIARSIRTNVVSASRPVPTAHRAAASRSSTAVNQWAHTSGKTSVLRVPSASSRVSLASSKVISASPGDVDDGEFSYLVPTDEDLIANGNTNEADVQVLHNSGFLETFVHFVQGNKPETLSSVAGSNIVHRPSLPKYIPETPRPGMRNALEQYALDKGKINIVHGPGEGRGGATVGKRGRGSRGGGTPTKSIGRGDGEQSWKQGLQEVGRQGVEAPIGRGGGRGRGRGSTTSAAATNTTVPNTVVMPTAEQPQIEPANQIAPNEPHFFQRGDFVLERKDAYKNEFPIWRIENGKLLQKFDPIHRDGQLVHKSASIYSSWAGEIRVNFKAILVETLATSQVMAGRKQEVIVKVLDRYVPQPPDDSLEQHPLMEVFNIYVQSILSQALDPTFLTQLQQQHEEYYEGPMRQVDQLLEQAKQAMLYEITWTDEFKVTAEALAAYVFAALHAPEGSCECQAQKDGTTMAVRKVKFYGAMYDRDLLEVSQDVPLLNAKEFHIGRLSIEYLGIYHALHHYKFLLYRKCVEEVRYLKQSHTKTDRDILSDCLQNRIWVQELFRDLTKLLEKYLIIRAEDDGAAETPAEGVEAQPAEGVIVKGEDAVMNQEQNLYVLNGDEQAGQMAVEGLPQQYEGMQADGQYDEATQLALQQQYELQQQQELQQQYEMQQQQQMGEGMEHGDVQQEEQGPMEQEQEEGMQQGEYEQQQQQQAYEQLQ